jgi:hypothetical protein
VFLCALDSELCAVERVKFRGGHDGYATQEKQGGQAAR